MQSGLYGDFGTMPLKDLLVYLGNKKVTGALELVRGRLRKTALVKDGHVITASSNEPREYLGQFLINMGHITEEQFEKAYQTQRETNIFLGKILVMTGQVSEAVVRNALSLKVRETLLEPFNWTEGNFGFDPSKPVDAPDGLDLDIDLIDIHREGDFRDTAWQAIRSVFTSGRMKLQVNEDKLAETPKPGSLDARLVALIKQGQTIDDMILSLHATDFFLYQRLYALYRLEAVAPNNLPEEDEPLSGLRLAADTSPSDLARQIEMLLAQGKATDAESFARAAVERHSSNAELQGLLRRAETSLLGELRRELVDTKAVPQLSMSPTKLAALKISAPERYLLSRVDGQKTVAAIVTVSPLQELQALRLFKRFADSGLVRFG
ncbi:MAG: DUF4388 domain-containing protein [Myxococcaceae bacterium]